MKFSIRRARAEDAARILACLAVAFEPFRAQYTPAGYRDTVLSPETITQRLTQMSLFVAEDAQGSIVGTIGCNGHAGGEGHLRGMAALPAWQGSGVAAALLRAAEEELERIDCAFITLDTTEPLQRAIRFYQRNGYRPTGKVSDFFGMALYEYRKELRGAGMNKVNLAEKFAKFSDHWSPKIIGELNDSYVKAVKVKGEFVWHHHDHEDELFLVTKGTLRMKFRDREEVIGAGEFIVVPRGVEHLPVADEETHIVLLEPKTTLNTGNVQSERTREVLDRI